MAANGDEHFRNDAAKPQKNHNTWNNEGKEEGRMKRLVLLVALALVLIPALALAQTDAPATTTDDVVVCMPPATDFADVKAYGDQSAEYGTGVKLVDPGHEEGFTETCTGAVAVDITKFCAENNAPGCWSNCGMDVGQLKVDASLTSTFTKTEFENCFKSISSSGIADMNSLAGISMCATNACASGSLFQTQTVNQMSFGEAAFGTANSSYVGTQTFKLNVN